MVVHICALYKCILMLHLSGHYPSQVFKQICFWVNHRAHAGQDMSEWHHMAILQANQKTFSSWRSSHNLRIWSYGQLSLGECQHCRLAIHPCKPTVSFIFRAYSPYFWGVLLFISFHGSKGSKELENRMKFPLPKTNSSDLRGDLGRKKESPCEPNPRCFWLLVSGKAIRTVGSSLPKSPGRWSQMLSSLTWQTIYLTCIYIIYISTVYICTSYR